MLTHQALDGTGVRPELGLVSSPERVSDRTGGARTDPVPVAAARTAGPAEGAGDDIGVALGSGLQPAWGLVLFGVAIPGDSEFEEALKRVFGVTRPATVEQRTSGVAEEAQGDVHLVVVATPEVAALEQPDPVLGDIREPAEVEPPPSVDNRLSQSRYIVDVGAVVVGVAVSTRSGPTRTV